jgi:hypothetical protein
MSVAEKKLLAFERLASLQNEAGIYEILTHLEKLNNEVKPRIYNLSKHTEAISQLYDETLNKLVQ